MIDNDLSQTIRLKSGAAFFQSSPRHFSWLLLTVFIFLIYAPFLGGRVVRPAGDDKVYVSQAIEMAERSAWFVQTLHNEPDYYKGPAHYLFLRVGMAVFGDSMWATVYMNLLFVILGAISLGAIVYRRLPEREGWAFWTGASFALGAGVYSHVYASQMEVELAGLYAIALNALDKSGKGRDTTFWLVAGFAGWFKSPLHSVLLGTSALFFWAMQGELLPRLKSWRAWRSVFYGVALCFAGYLPALILDRENFMNAYVYRETLWKPANGSKWHYPVVPFFTYFLFPWMLPAFIAALDIISRLWRKRSSRLPEPKGVGRLLGLGFALVIPTVAFFAYHPYRGQNYMLPAVGGMFVILAALWSTRSDSWSKIYSFSVLLTALLVIAVPVALTIVVRHFDPMPFWWPSWLLPLLWIGAFFTARGLYREGITFSLSRPDSLARRWIWIYLALGALLTAIGEREMADIRLRIEQARLSNESLRISYMNLHKNIWSEWGYLNFQVPHKVRGVFSEKELEDAIYRGDLIAVPGDEFLLQLRNFADLKFRGWDWEIAQWRRWRTKGKNAEGVPVWREAWDKRDLSILEKKFYLVRLKKKA